MKRLFVKKGVAFVGLVMVLAVGMVWGLAAVKVHENWEDAKPETKTVKYYLIKQEPGPLPWAETHKIMYEWDWTVPAEGE